MKYASWLTIIVFLASAFAQAPRSETNVEKLSLPDSIKDIRPSFVTADSTEVFILDGDTHKIFVLNRDNKLIRTLGGIGQAPGELFHAFSVELTSSRDLVIHDKGNNRIQIWDASGRAKVVFDDRGAYQIAVHPSGFIIANQPASGALLTVYDMRGNVVRRIGKPDTVARLYGPSRLTYNAAYRYSASALRLHVGTDGIIRTANLIAPLIRQFSLNGALLSEMRLSDTESNHLETLFWDPKHRGPMLGQTLKGEVIDIMSIGVAEAPDGGTYYLRGDSGLFLVKNRTATKMMANIATAGSDSVWMLAQAGIHEFFFPMAFSKKIYRLWIN